MKLIDGIGRIIANTKDDVKHHWRVFWCRRRINSLRMNRDVTEGEITQSRRSLRWILSELDKEEELLFRLYHRK